MENIIEWITSPWCSVDYYLIVLGIIFVAVLAATVYRQLGSFDTAFDLSVAVTCLAVVLIVISFFFASFTLIYAATIALSVVLLVLSLVLLTDNSTISMVRVDELKFKLQNLFFAITFFAVIIVLMIIIISNF